MKFPNRYRNGTWSGHHFGYDVLPKNGWTLWPPFRVPGWAFQLKSPITACLVDAQGRRTGYVAGSVFEEIPLSYYVPEGSRTYPDSADPEVFSEAHETIFMATNSNMGEYSLILTGTDDGSYELVTYDISEDSTDSVSIGFDIHKDEVHTFDVYLDSAGEMLITGVPARLDFDPDTVSLSSRGKWVTCYIELPDGFDVNLIDGSTVELNGIPAEIGKQDWATPEANSSNIVDHDGDGVPERMVKFDLFYLQVLLTPGDADVTVSGELTDGTTFDGSDMIRVIE